MHLDIVRLETGGSTALAAGSFSVWLAMMDLALREGSGSDVPCGDCTACCQGAYFIQVTRDDTAALATIPAELLFPAPGAPAGKSLLGYDEQGRCPMLKRDACTVYADRPRTCRTYDCRIFAATGLAEPGAAKAAIMARAASWKFDYADAQEQAAHAALQTGTRFLLEQSGALADVLPGNATQLAMLAVRLHPLLIELALAHGREIPASTAVLERVRAAVRRIDSPAG